MMTGPVSTKANAEAVSGFSPPDRMSQITMERAGLGEERMIAKVNSSQETIQASKTSAGWRQTRFHATVGSILSA
jgi:hypothetical protein